MNVNIFKAIGDLALSAKKRKDNEHADFLAFYRNLVETLPTEIVALFGNMGGVAVWHKGKEKSCGLELTATDFMWWKTHIEAEGVRFVNTPASVKCDMLDRLARHAEAHRLSPEERKNLLSLLKQSRIAA